MKKFLSTAMIIAALAMTVTGCSRNNDGSSDAGSSDTGSSVTTSEAGTGSDGGNTSGDSEAAALTARDMAANVLTAVEWPALMEVSDNETASMMFGIDTNLCEDFYFTNQMMSVHLNEILIAKPKSGSEEDLKAQFDARFAYIKDGAAFYPEQEESAAGAVSGTTDDGYLYIIVHAEGAKAQEAMLNNPPAEMPGADAGAEGGDTAEGGLTARDMAANILATGEWPMLMEVSDAETASMIGIDIGLCEDYYIAIPSMSAHVTEVIVAKPLAGSEQALEEQIIARYNYVQENGAFYPDNEAVVAGAVKGTTDDGYMYMIVHTDGASCADAMMNNPPAEMPAM